MRDENSGPSNTTDQRLSEVDTCKEHYLNPDHARADTEKEYFQNAIDGRNNYPILYEPKLEDSSSEEVKPLPDVEQEKRPRSRKKRFWLLLIVGVLLVGGIVGGTVGGIKARNQHSQPATSSSSSSAAAGSTNPQPSTAQPADPNAHDSRLASVAWQDAAGTGHRRLYHQNVAGAIQESAWDSDTKKWQIFNQGLANAKLGSPLAAAVVGPQNFTFQISLFYIDVSGHLLEMYTSDGKVWNNGSLTAEAVVPSSESELAATFMAYPGCEICTRTLLLAYENDDQKLRVANRTASNVSWTTLEANPNFGSGLTISPSWRKKAPPGARLYYQRNVTDLISSDWEAQGGLSGSDGQGWTSHDKELPVGHVTAGAPMASFTWGFDDDDDKSKPFLLDILSTGARGVAVAWYGGTSARSWQEPQRPDVMGNVQDSSALATNADRHVYAFSGGTVKEFTVDTDGVSWSLVGDVPTV